MIRGLLLIAIAVCLGVWWWRRSYVPSPLDVHYADLAYKQNIGNMAQLAAYASPPPVAMMGTGWGTTCRINPNNPASTAFNTPGKLMLNFRFAQPTGNNA
jgi:hypothetical protein